MLRVGSVEVSRQKGLDTAAPIPISSDPCRGGSTGWRRSLVFFGREDPDVHSEHPSRPFGKRFCGRSITGGRNTARTWDSKIASGGTEVGSSLRLLACVHLTIG